MCSSDLESLEDKAKALAPFSIARVISAEQHPNADRLRVCMVDTGGGAAPVQVVCGAPNARAGLVSVFSPPGTFIPGKNITLGVGTIRGVESRGMLCSAAELQISEDHDGIVELPPDAPIGRGYAGWAGGQLEEELTAGGWLTAKALKKLIFQNPDELWEQVTRTIGEGILNKAIKLKHVPDDPSLN